MVLSGAVLLFRPETHPILFERIKKQISGYLAIASLILLLKLKAHLVSERVVIVSVGRLNALEELVRCECLSAKTEVKLVRAKAKKDRDR